MMTFFTSFRAEKKSACKRGYQVGLSTLCHLFGLLCFQEILVNITYYALLFTHYALVFAHYASTLAILKPRKAYFNAVGIFIY